VEQARLAEDDNPHHLAGGRAHLVPQYQFLRIHDILAKGTK
jgi:hypothetical protein